MHSEKSLLIVLMLLVSVMLAVVGCGTYSSEDNAVSPSYTSPSEEEPDTYGAREQGETDGSAAGKEAFLADPENSMEYAEAPDDGGYSTEEEQEAYKEGWEDGYTGGYEEAYDELVEQYQQEHPYGD